MEPPWILKRGGLDSSGQREQHIFFSGKKKTNIKNKKSDLFTKSSIFFKFLGRLMIFLLNSFYNLKKNVFFSLDFPKVTKVIIKSH